jgi:hypothetical protein
MQLHWAGKVALPAIVCAGALALLTARPYRPRQSIASSATLFFAGVTLLLLPVIASALAPEVQGNGQHANEGSWAGIRCWIVGIPVLMPGLVRLALLQASRWGAWQRRSGTLPR